MLSKRMAGLTPYTAGEQPRDKTYIKLNTNENPYAPPKAVEEYLRSVDPAIFRRYPDPKMTGLREALATADGVAPEQIFVGNGSDEVLSFAFYGFFDTVTFPDVTYSFYPVYCDFYGIPYTTVPVGPELEIDLEDYGDPDTPVIFANPNSPTGTYIGPKIIETFLQNRSKDAVVVVDEAYINFGGISVVGLLDDYPNLLVVRTFSKSHSLAGLRLGYALGHTDLIDALFTIKDSFNSYPVSTLAQELGIRAIRDGEDSNTNLVIQGRTRVTAELQGLGWKVLPSMSNFLFATMPGKNGEFVYTRLKERGVLVRYFSSPRLRDFVRITIGTEAEMDRFLAEVEGLGKGK